MSDAHRRWELDPASSEDYRERLDALDSWRAGERFRRWLGEQPPPPSANVRPALKLVRRSPKP